MRFSQERKALLRKHSEPKTVRRIRNESEWKRAHRDVSSTLSRYTEEYHAVSVNEVVYIIYFSTRAGTVTLTMMLGVR